MSCQILYCILTYSSVGKTAYPGCSAPVKMSKLFLPIVFSGSSHLTHVRKQSVTWAVKKIQYWGTQGHLLG